MRYEDWSYFRWITDTENQETDEKYVSYRKRRALEGETGGPAGCQRRK